MELNKLIRTNKYRLYPSSTQKALLFDLFSLSRNTWNLSLDDLLKLDIKGIIKADSNLEALTKEDFKLFKKVKSLKKYKAVKKLRNV